MHSHGRSPRGHQGQNKLYYYNRTRTHVRCPAAPRGHHGQNPRATAHVQHDAPLHPAAIDERVAVRVCTDRVTQHVAVDSDVRVAWERGG